MFNFMRKKDEKMSYTKEHVFDEEIADRISNYIKLHGLSFRQVADKAGMTYNQMYQILHKNQLIKLREYTIICNALGVSFDYFIYGPKVISITTEDAVQNKDYFEPF